MECYSTDEARAGLFESLMIEGLKKETIGDISGQKTFMRKYSPLLQTREAYPKMIIARTKHLKSLNNKTGISEIQGRTIWQNSAFSVPNSAIAVLFLNVYLIITDLPQA